MLMRRLVTLILVLLAALLLCWLVLHIGFAEPLGGGMFT